MSHHAQEHWSDTIAATLNNIDGDFIARGAATWEFTVRNGLAAKVVARLGGNWISLDAPLAHVAGTSPEHAGKWLRVNHGLPGGARIALQDDLVPSVCADIVLHTDVDVAGRLRECCAGIRAAIHGVCSDGAEGPDRIGMPEPGAAPLEEGEQDSPELRMPDGWSLTHAGDGKWTCALDVPGTFCQAEVSLTRRGAVRVSAELAAHAPWSGASRLEAALFMARTNHIIRLGRAIILESGDGAAISLECGFDALPAPQELGEALSAVSAGSLLTHSELHALKSAPIARAYLAALGWDPAASAA